jgi:pyruvate dehydrogenase (quinone)
VIQVDVRGERIGRRVPVAFPLAGTVRDTVDALLPLLVAKDDSAHLDRMTAHYRRARARLDKLARDRRNESPLHPQYVAATVDRLAAADAVFTADVGTPCIWADQAQPARTRSRITRAGRRHGNRSSRRCLTLSGGGFPRHSRG